VAREKETLPVPPGPLAPSQETVEAPPDKPAQVRPVHKHAEHIGPFRILEKIGEGLPWWMASLCRK
jgi:hypothetical protein